jgi:hypothetical protein
MRRKKIGTIIAGTLLTLILGIPLSVLIFYRPDACPDNPLVHDNAAVIAQESVALMKSLRQAHKLAPTAFAPRIATPVEIIAIENKGATVRFDSPVAQGDLYPAEIWRDVFRRYHPGLKTQCARLTSVWKDQSETVQCCNNSL